MSTVRTVRRIAALVSIGAVSLAPLPATALADNGPSAGDQQYVDPLSGSSTPAASHPSSASTGSSSGSSAGSSSGSSAGSSSSSAPAASSTASSGSTAAASPGTTAAASGSTSGRTLPFTGFDGELAVGLGCGLLAGGVLLRRRLAASDR